MANLTIESITLEIDGDELEMIRKALGFWINVKQESQNVYNEEALLTNLGGF